MTFEAEKSKAFAQLSSTVAGLKNTHDVVFQILQQIPDSRELTNKEFVFFYWHYTAHYVVPPQVRAMLTDPETVRRVKQKILEKEHPDWKPKDQELTEAKLMKKWGVEEWVTS